MALTQDLRKTDKWGQRNEEEEVCGVLNADSEKALMNEKLSDLRREMYNKMTDKLQRNVLQCTQCLLMMNLENLKQNEKVDERAQFNRRYASKSGRDSSESTQDGIAATQLICRTRTLATPPRPLEQRD